MSILTLNCGSSSVKYAVFDEQTGDFICQGIVERVGTDESRLIHKSGTGQKAVTEKPCENHTQAVELVLDTLTVGDDSCLQDTSSIRGVGHRVVHGGEKFARSAKVTDELLQAVEEVADLAPLHNPPNLAGIKAAKEVLPDIPHVAVFDTAFHQSMQPAAYLYALPYEWYEKYGIRRYGFHGTSHLYVSLRAAALLKKPLAELKMVTLHVGNGASATAISKGHSQDTSMGLTPLEGLVMGTRCGWIDPAIPLFVMQREDIPAGDMDRILNKKSGLLGFTGEFNDRRDIEKGAEEGNLRCEQAIDLEALSLKKTIGSYAAAMGGLDCVVFTAGVGENSPIIRKRVLEKMEFLGIHLDLERNENAIRGKAEMQITTDESPVKVLVIPTNEELVIAEDTLAIIENTFNSAEFRYSFE